ncbi:MAG: exodeoxyribonuclease III [Dehalococcoidia bacterium]
MRIVTWNVNSIRARENRVLNWLQQARPDVLCLQELKCTEEQFPYDGFEQLGYYLTIHGQKTYNGVAIASLDPPADVETAVPWPDDSHARGIAATVNGLRVVSVYVPNGAEVGSEKYAYKLEWLDRLQGWVEEHASAGEPLVLCGDFNVAPQDRDVHDPDAWREKVLCSTPERERFQALTAWGLVDAFRCFHEEEGRFTWWDYRAGALQRNLGLRIDHHLVTPALLQRAEDVEIDVDERRGDKPSDHAPVTLVLREA